MRTLSIINLKGGVAKTISAINIAYTLASVHGRRVLLIDNDKQGNTSSFANWAAYHIRHEIRLMLSLHRKLPRVQMLTLSLDAPLTEGEEPTLGDTVAAEMDIEADALRKELVLAVRAAVDRLPEEQRSLVRLCDLQGRALRDVAQTCGTAFNVAQNTRKKAQKALFLDKTLRALTTERELDRTTDWHRHVGVENYRSTWVSSTEALVFQREERHRMLQK